MEQCGREFTHRVDSIFYSMHNKKRVLVGLSGGIDSSVSAYLLQKDGYEVEGVYMKLYDNEKYHSDNIAKVKDVSKFLGIKYHILDLSTQFRDEVYTPFIEAYRDGITPNPCVTCNREIKFGEMHKFMKSLNCDYLSTGHYVKVINNRIYEANDKSKDQSYFLAQISKDVLSDLIFPLSNLSKEYIKDIAKDIDVLDKIAQNSESQEICFVESSYIDILREHYLVDNIGKVYNSDGSIVGEHKGYMQYTIGKRKGFRVFIAHEPHYVLKINSKSNSLVVGKKDELKIISVILDNLNIFDNDLNKRGFICSIKLRYRTKKTDCRVNIRGKKAFINLLEPVYGVAKGQVGVLYREDMVLGSGVIISVS